MKILILGVGAIGSNLTNRLVSDLKGEHEITVLDMDTVEERNVIAGTQFFTRDQIGMPKVEALQYNIYKFHEREIEINNVHFDKIFPMGNYDLIIDCFDNNIARSDVHLGYLLMKKYYNDAVMKNKVDVIHIGFSDQFTFAIEWAENYQVPDDIVSGMDICEMVGASSFVNYVASIASMVVQEFIRNNKKIEIIGNRMSHTIIK